MRSYISLDGIMSYLENIGTPLFSAVSLPSGIDRDTLVNTIYQDGAEFGIIYPEPTFFRNRVNAWFLTKYKTFEKWYNVLNMDYNPIENYDRMEAWSDTGTISDTGSRTDTGTSHDTTESATDLTGVTGLQTSKNGTTSGTNGETINGTSSETTSDTSRKQTDTTGTDTIAENKTETIDQDGTSRTVTDATTETETKVSAFNDGSAYQPKELVSSDSDTTVTGTTTNDQTTTTADNITKTTTGQEIEQTTASGTKNGTTEQTTSGTTSGTSSETGAETENKHDVTEFDSESNGRTTLQSNTTGSRESDGEHEGRVHGNIGVTTTQQMIEQELSLRKNYNIYNMISDSFCDEFLIQVY